MASQPWKTTVQIDDMAFNTYSANFVWTTKVDRQGLPLMGSLDGGLELEVDIHDRDNLPWKALQRLLHTLIPPVRKNMSPIKITYWQDDSRQDAICAIEFTGLVTSWCISNSPGQNHILKLLVKPTTDIDSPYAGMTLTT